MKIKKINAALVWKQVEDLLVPRLRLSVTDRVVYYHLVRPAMRRLVDYGALRVLERSKAGHLVEVRLPEEIPAIWPDAREAVNPEKVDFFKTRALRQAIHSREDGRCFYCLRQTNGRMRCIDHVVPQARLRPTPTATGLLLPGMQLVERRTPRRGLSSLALPQALPEPP